MFLLQRLQSNLTNGLANDTEISQETQADLLNSIEKNLKTLLTQEGETNYQFNSTAQKYLRVHHNQNQTVQMMDKTAKGCVHVSCENLGKKQVIKISANVSAAFSVGDDDFEKCQLNKTVSFTGRIKIKADEDKNKSLAYRRSFCVKSESDAVVKVFSKDGTFESKCKHNWISSHVHVFRHSQCDHSNCKVLGTAFHHHYSKEHSKKANCSKVLTVENSGNSVSTFTLCDKHSEEVTIDETEPTEVTNNDSQL